MLDVENPNSLEVTREQIPCFCMVLVLLLQVNVLRDMATDWFCQSAWSRRTLSCTAVAPEQNCLMFHSHKKAAGTNKRRRRQSRTYDINHNEGILRENVQSKVDHTGDKSEKPCPSRPTT